MRLGKGYRKGMTGATTVGHFDVDAMGSGQKSRSFLTKKNELMKKTMEILTRSCFRNATAILPIMLAAISRFSASLHDIFQA